MPANEILFVVVVLILAAIWVAREIFAYRVRKKLADEKRRADERNQREGAEWQQIIALNINKLPSKNWRDPSGKEEFIRAVLDGATPLCQRFSLGRGLAEEDWQKFFELNKAEKWVRFQVFTPGDLEVGVALEIFGAKEIIVEIKLGDRTLPLYEVAHFVPDRTMPVHINFLDLYERKG